MEEKKELTYILGAGASYESIPLVKNFPRRFMFFVDSMQKLTTHQDVAQIDKDNVKKLHNYSFEFYKEIASHQSFDTFFKKLYHTEEIFRINLFKKVLNIYFLWENVTIEKGNSSGNVHNPEQEGDFIKQSRVDKRYDALIAGLLKPQKGNPQSYCKVNFITWNYDLNLLMSLKNYFSPNSTIGEFINSINQKDGIWKLGDDFTVINMNGFFYRNELNSLRNLENVKINEMIFSIISEDYFNDTFIDDDSNLIKFAWESDNTQADIAREKINKSENIVVIGYTFPLYNRFVDLKIIPTKSLYPSEIGIHIQDIDAKKRVESFIDNFKMRLKANEIYSIEDCNYFYIPSNIFGASDGNGEYYIL